MSCPQARSFNDCQAMYPEPQAMDQRVPTGANIKAHWLGKRIDSGSSIQSMPFSKIEIDGIRGRSYCQNWLAEGGKRTSNKRLEMIVSKKEM